jgi:hypothetical protein
MSQSILQDMFAVNMHNAKSQTKTYWVIFCLEEYSLAQSEDVGSSSFKTATTVWELALTADAGEM